MTSTTRTDSTDSARARSLASAVIWLAFTPGAGRSSKRVTTGPGCTATTSASMAKSLSFISTSRDSASSASGEYSGSRGGGSSRSLSGGSSLAFGGSNSGTWRSRSTRALFSNTGSGGSMRGDGGNADLLFSVANVPLGAWRRSGPSVAGGRASQGVRPRGQSPRLHAPLHPDGCRGEHRGEQVRRTPEEEEQHVGEPRADDPDAVVNRRSRAGEGEARVLGTVGGERHEQHQGHDAERNDGALAQPAGHRRCEARHGACRNGAFSQSHDSP